MKVTDPMHTQRKPCAGKYWLPENERGQTVSWVIIPLLCTCMLTDGKCIAIAIAVYSWNDNTVSVAIAINHIL